LGGALLIGLEVGELLELGAVGPDVVQVRHLAAREVPQRVRAEHDPVVPQPVRVAAEECVIGQLRLLRRGVVEHVHG
jgi:hypothetical protein